MRQEQNQEEIPGSQVKKHFKKDIISCQMLVRGEEEEHLLPAGIGYMMVNQNARHIVGIHVLLIVNYT